MKYTKIFILLSAIITGCTGIMTSSISENQISEINSKLIDEHSMLINKAKTSIYTEWVQPINKKEECKIYVALLKGDTKKRQISWDGGCKNGYAYGLGREFVKGDLIDEEWLSYYEGPNEPIYFYMKDNLNNTKFEGKISKHKMVGLKTIINDDGIRFNFIPVNMYDDLLGKGFSIINSPLSQYIRYVIDYKNFAYVYDVSKNNTNPIIFAFRTMTKNKNNFAYVKYRNGNTKGFELINGRNKEVNLPQSFVENINNMYNEIISKKDDIERCYREGLMAKEQYKQKIKNLSPIKTVPHDKYFAILNEKRENELIKQKIDNELKIRKEQHNIERQIKAQEAIASAAQDQSAEINRLNSQNFINNMNIQNQMQNLNNNLFLMRMGY